MYLGIQALGGPADRFKPNPPNIQAMRGENDA
jgi:hypothetical protein